jgi:hypothetical protein
VTTLQKNVLEFPLMSWTEVNGSKIKLIDSLKMPLELIKIYFKYNIPSIFRTKSGYSIFDSKINFPSIYKIRMTLMSIF